MVAVAHKGEDGVVIKQVSAHACWITVGRARNCHECVVAPARAVARAVGGSGGACTRVYKGCTRPCTRVYTRGSGGACTRVYITRGLPARAPRPRRAAQGGPLHRISSASTFIPCSIVLHFGVGARPFRDMPLYSKGRSTSVAARGRLA
jgi:hypothetical protein